MEKVNKKLEFLTDEFGNLYYDKKAYMDAVYYELGTKNKSVEIAKNLLAKKLDTNFISEVTGLTIEEIEGIQNNN